MLSTTNPAKQLVQVTKHWHVIYISYTCSIIHCVKSFLKFVQFCSENKSSPPFCKTGIHNTYSLLLKSCSRRKTLCKLVCRWCDVFVRSGPYMHIQRFVSSVASVCLAEDNGYKTQLRGYFKRDGYYASLEAHAQGI